MNLGELTNVARARWFAVALCTLLGALVAAGVSMLLPVTYEASARLFTATPNWNDSTSSYQPDSRGQVPDFAFGDEFTQRRVLTYQQLANTPAVASAVIDRLGLQTTPSELEGRLSARAVPDTVLLDVRARDVSPERAAAIADAAAEEVAEVIKELEKPFTQVESPVQPVLLNPATVPDGPMSPRTTLNILAGATLGLLVGLTYAVARERTKAANMPFDLAISETTLGVLHNVEDIRPFVRLDDVGHALAEDVRFLCLRLTERQDDGHDEDGAQTMLLVSPRVTDATSTTAVLAAAGFAETGRRVVVVLTNFATGTTSAPEPGLGEVLDEREPLRAVLKYDDTSRIAVMTAGATLSPPMVALAGDRFDQVMQQLATRFDYVILIGRPVLESADSLQLATKVHRSILVCPVPPSTASEIVESERLLGLVSPQPPGRVLVVDRDESSGLGGVASSGRSRSRKVTAEA